MRVLFVCPGNICRLPTAHSVLLDNLEQLRRRGGDRVAGEMGLFLACAPALAVDEVPDPYYGDDRGFAHVLDLVEAASDALINRLERELA